ncbi:class I SAM-dependent methyltransferase [Candidatus Borrarchaeum sp.]|uniref:class I SAM-dependent DNA methyltransferase n=1 Tax=Candidatus Borrarchaeum sp. TaxID=2846742 RepID=UPI0025806FD8|nr:class I SAM-dependent methyltransferase [Candidatus Borrarchaeum sp.]
MEPIRSYEKFAEVYDLVTPEEFYFDYFNFIKKILKSLNYNPQNILDVACGTGRLAKILLDKDYDVEGLDISESMLEIARKRGLKVYQSNMVDFNVGQKYDLIISTYDSLNYVLQESSLKKCFNSIKKHLNQKGIFICDMNSDYKINKVLPEYKVDYYDFSEVNAELIWLNSYQKNYWIGEVILFKKAEDGKYDRFYEKYIERAYELKTIKKLLKEAEFEILETYSDFELNKIKKDSKRWFFVNQIKTD